MVRFDAPRLIGPGPQAGRIIERVESHGKHLEIVWDDGLVLHTHMRMTGSWHLYRTGDSWRRPYHQMRATIETEDWVAVCFNAPLVETYRQPDRRRHPGMGRLGPDLCKADTDLGEVVNLVLSYPDAQTRLGEVLLDQRVMCGVGNVYRAEVLWATELSPFARIGTLTEHDAIRLVNTAATMLRANLTTVPPRHRRRRQGRAGGLRTQRSALPPLRRDDRLPQDGRARPHALLVPGLPAASRPVSRAVGRRHPDGSAPGRPTLARRSPLEPRRQLSTLRRGRGCGRPRSR